MSTMGAESAKHGVRTVGEGVDGSIRTDVEALKQELARLRDDLAATAKTAASLGKHGFAEAKGRAETAYESAKEHVHHAADAARHKAEQAAHFARDKAKEGVEKAEGTIKDHPFASVAVAFGAGLLIGALLRK